MARRGQTQARSARPVVSREEPAARAPARRRASASGSRTDRRRARAVRRARRLALERARGIGSTILALLPPILWLLARGVSSRSALGLFAAVVGAAALGAGIVHQADHQRQRLGASGRWLLDAAFVLLAVAGAWWQAPGVAVDEIAAVVDSGPRHDERSLRHQVWASYRRMDLAGQAKIMERAAVHVPTIFAAARAFAVDPEVLVGLAATESSFLPRESRDGGQGLFQLTAVPAEAREAARQALGVAALVPGSPRDDAFVAAAMLARYRDQMDGDLFLMLLAYNVGPRNGGLRTILQQYGARSFVQAQPYLQALPREYPIRVLSAAVAFRVWRLRGSLPRYEQGRTARDLQQMGVPGLDPAADLTAMFGGMAAPPPTRLPEQRGVLRP